VASNGQPWAQGVQSVGELAETRYGVQFIQTNALYRGTPLNNLNGSRQGSLSFWFRSELFENRVIFAGAPTASMGYPLPTGGFASAAVGDNSTFIFLLQDAAGANQLIFAPIAIELDDNEWHHLGMSWDTNFAAGARVLSCCFDGEPTTPVIGLDTGVAFTPSWGAAGFTLGAAGFQAGPLPANPLNGALGEVYLNTKEYIDFSNPSNIQKFIDVQNFIITPVDVGENGAMPTGNQPTIYMSERTVDPTTFFDNRGDGGTFQLFGPALSSAWELSLLSQSLVPPGQLQASLFDPSYFLV
jgi:hypothetical protein